MKNIFYLLLLVLFQSVVYGQTKNISSSFHLTGTIKADTGTVLLLPVGGKDFDPNKNNNYKAVIKQGIFVFDGNIAYPGAFIIAFFPSYVSSPFILESGAQEINCNIDSVREIPHILNKSMRELKAAPVNFFSSLNTSTDRQNSLSNYAKQHPTSYIALWETVRQLEIGYTPVLDSIYNAFSISLKNNYTGKIMAQRLASTKVTALGQVFPSLSLLDIDNKLITIPAQRKSTYILIDFWYVRCSACISEFPELEKVFETYKDKGFDIAGISIDKSADMALWKSTIKKRKLVWNQYLDIAGKLTLNQLYVNYFPSNFLLDKKGIIVKRNIRPIELSKFLSEKL